jgi:hypothetical protein
MKKNLTFAWIASLFALFGQLLYFIGVSAFTGEWGYAMWSAMVSMVGDRSTKYAKNVEAAQNATSKRINKQAACS